MGDYVDDMLLATLLSMGFDVDASKRALSATGNTSVDAAINHMFANPQPSQPAPVPVTQKPKPKPECRPSQYPREPPVKRRKPSLQTSLSGLSVSAEIYESGYDSIDQAFEMEQFERDHFKVVGLDTCQNEVINGDKIAEEMFNEIVEVAEVCEVNITASAALLRKAKWDKQRLMEMFFDNPKKLLRSIGVEKRETASSSKVTDIPPGSECLVCADDLTPENTRALGCGHLFCTECWKGYLEVHVNEGRTLDLTCMAHKCNTTVDEETVRVVCSPEVYAKYCRFLTKMFVDDNPYVQWCPAKSCGNAVRCETKGAQHVACSCGHKFCFSCSSEAHLPATCKMLRKWEKKAKDDSETFNWLSANTKHCPKCDSSIEKNGGCNHMTCRKCRAEFCWLCMGDWRGHTACNAYKAKEIENNQASGREKLERYLHYWMRYSAHENSKNLELGLREKAITTMVNLRKARGHIQGFDVSFVDKATEQLIECRRTLKHTYVYAFYLKKGAKKDLFEYLQADLESVTEKLSGADSNILPLINDLHRHAGE